MKQSLLVIRDVKFHEMFGVKYFTKYFAKYFKYLKKFHGCRLYSSLQQSK